MNASMKLTGDLDADASALSDALAPGQARLAAMPAKPARDEAQRRDADTLLAHGRDLRRAFLARHARAVYAQVVQGRDGHVSLSSLAAAAAERFPGLVPTAAQLEAECRGLQRDKDRLEVDQALLVHAFLALPDVGEDLLDRLRRPTPKGLQWLQTFRRDDHVHIGPVELERRGDGGHLTFHNVACLNAEDDALIDAVETAVDVILLDERIRVGVLRGGEMTHPRYRGKRVFSAGINLKHLHGGRISYLDFLLRRECGTLNKIAHGLGGATPVEKPFVAVVDTFAIGGGAQITLACDHVIAEPTAFFSLPAAAEGIVPGLANLRLPRFTGARLARRIILDGLRVRASDPDGPRLFDEVVHPAELDAAVDAAVERFRAEGVIANRRMLRLTEEPVDALRRYLAQFAIEQADRIYSDDVLSKVARA
jgi:thioesterase DpgC